tara:strand:+ start:9543 stop:9818 length:276 start_codon:yes stop_codon:yes gene_type:complete
MDEYKVSRRGRSKITRMVDERLETVFHEVDNLDTKQLHEAIDSYERTFITARIVLENFKDEQINLNSEAARLTLCQEITENLHQARLIRKD